MNFLNEIKESLLHLAFPHICDGCGTDALSRESSLCLRCLSRLPETRFHLYTDNPVEKIFWGRLPVINATAQFYFTKESLMQRLMHQFKYRGQTNLGLFLGQLMGRALTNTTRFSNMDMLVPLPLFAAKEKKRGFNQATILCDGMARILGKPVHSNIIKRTTHTETQTKKTRLERWQNMEGRFELLDPGMIEDRHVLLVDDVITTGASLEACGKVLLQAKNTRLSLATLCFSAH